MNRWTKSGTTWRDVRVRVAGGSRTISDNDSLCINAYIFMSAQHTPNTHNARDRRCTDINNITYK